MPIVLCMGGETAIMPDIYKRGEYDLAGFCVGVVERRHVITGSNIAPGDMVLGIESSGFHSNGYSLVRKVVFEMAGLGVNDAVPQLGRKVGEALLEPTKIYVRPIRKILNHYKVKHVLHGIAHITGGGLLGNLERIIPPGCRAVIERGSWEIPPVMTWLQQLGGIAEDEMDRVFNMGLGMALVFNPHYESHIRRTIEDCGLKSWKIGEIVAGEQGIGWKV